MHHMSAGVTLFPYTTLFRSYRANNIGVALLEQYKHKEAADAFRRALQLDPALAIARINLGIALFNVPELPAAQRELQDRKSTRLNSSHLVSSYAGLCL